MEVDASQNQRLPLEGQTSDCRSSGSNYHPSSQSRKISIGVMVDSVGKGGSRAAKEDEVAVPIAARMNLNVGNLIELKKKGQEVRTPGQESSTWISTRSPDQEAPFADTVLHAEQPGTISTHSKLHGQKNAQATYLVQYLPNKTSNLEFGDGNHKKFDGVTSKRKEVKNAMTERVEEFTFASAQDIHLSNRVVTADIADKTENRTETLKMKLWEILGNVSSPNGDSNSQRQGIIDNNSKLEQNSDQMGGMVVRLRQNSDPIETDSEGLDHTIRRPVTRSLARKRAPSKAQAKVTKCDPLTNSTRKRQEKNIFSFEEGCCSRQDASINGGSESTRKNGDTRIEPCKFFSPKKDKIQPPSVRETRLPAKRTSFSNRTGGIHDYVPENEREYIGLEKKIQERNSHLSPLTDKTGQQMDFESPEKGDKLGIANPSPTDVVDPQGLLHSPTFGFKTPISTSTSTSSAKTGQQTHDSPTSTPKTVQQTHDSPTSTPKTDQQTHDSPTTTPKTDQQVHGVPITAPAERIFSVADIRSFGTLQSSKPDYGSNTKTRFSLVADELKFSTPQEAAADIEEKDTENSLSESIAEEDYESLEEGSPINVADNDCRERESVSPDIDAVEKPKFFHSIKRLRTREGIRLDNMCSASPTPKGTGESIWIQEFSEQSQEDPMLRAVKLFSLELLKLQSKIKSETTKKSSEILISVADGICLQLQNLEADIQTDVGKLTSLSRSKRKRLEVKFEEEQKQLKLIHEKFKKDIDQYLQNRRSILEGMEAHREELKGAVEIQKASHRKLLSKVEGAVEAQLTDAERRIAAIHELARRKMLQLKHVISLCLKDDILS